MIWLHSAALMLLLAACNSGGGAWTKAGADQAAAGQAYDECRELADTAVQTEANVDQDIVASRGGDWGRSSIGRIGTQSMRERTGDRSANIIAACPVYLNTLQMRLTFVSMAALVAVALLCACGSGEQEPVRSATSSPRPARPVTVEMKAIETPAPPPAETPVPEVFVEAYHHHEGPPAIVSSEPEAGPAAPAAPAAPPLPDRPIAELLHPPPYTVFVDAGHGALDSGAGNGDLLEMRLVHVRRGVLRYVTHAQPAADVIDTEPLQPG